MDPLTVVKGLYGGHFIEELAERLEQVTNECKAVGNAGAVGFKVDVKPIGVGEPEIHFETTFASTLPKSKKRLTVLFSDKDGSLKRSDPRQIPMDFRPVEAGPDQVQTVAETAADVREA